MRPIENLHYAIGEIAYAVAMSDGEIQAPERKKFFDIVAAGLRRRNYGFDISSIIFQVLDKKRESSENSYHWAMNQIKVNSHYLSPELKTTFLKVIEEVAKAFPPVTTEEAAMIEKFQKEISMLYGDPVFYDQFKPKN